MKQHKKPSIRPQSIDSLPMIMCMIFHLFLLLSVAAAFSSHDLPRRLAKSRKSSIGRSGARRTVSSPSFLFFQEENLIDEQQQQDRVENDFTSAAEEILGETPSEGKLGKRERLKKLLRIWRTSASSSSSSETNDELCLVDDGDGEDPNFFDNSSCHYVTKRGSVFAEGRTMLALSDMIYAFVRLRSYAKRHDDQALQKKLQVPQISSTLTPAIIDNIRLLKKGKKFESDFVERARQTVNQAEFSDNSKENSEVIYFGDSSDNCQNSCVYGIGVNRSEKRISVWFRGTVMEENGLNHWEKNFDTTLRLEENPLDELLESIPTFHLHRGFVRSILGRRRKIMLKILQYKKEHPETAEFPLVVSGHSLGGALATLFGFYASLEPEFTKNGPVRVYTFAAPPVGDQKFGKIFRHLEEIGNIRLARIHNADDPVPSAFSLTRYKHVGLGIELNFSDYEIIDKDRSSVGKITKIFRGRGEHKLQRSYEYLNRHAVGFNSTLDEMYKSELGI